MAIENTKEVPGPFDGFATAKPGEPIFTLQGGDPIAARLVHLWAWRARKIAIREMGDTPKGQALLLRAREAEKVAWSMEEYLRGEVELPPEPVQTYSGVQPDQAALDAIERNQALVHANGRLHNALYEANEQVERLRALGFDGAALQIEQAVALLHEAADAILPSRGQ